MRQVQRQFMDLDVYIIILLLQFIGEGGGLGSAL